MKDDEAYENDSYKEIRNNTEKDIVSNIVNYVCVIQRIAFFKLNQIF